MKPIFNTVATAVTFGLFAAVAPAQAADESQMMSKCNRYAAHHLHLSTSDIADLSYEGQRVDGTHAVNGSTSQGQTFQCSFNASGKHVVNWTHSAARGCPVDVSEADRYRYPDCG